LGFETRVFASGEDFLRSCQAWNAACVITDVHMPAMSGFDLQAHVGRDGHRIPFIFITAYPDEQIRARALREGAVCFLNKPFTEAELVAGIRAALGSRRAKFELTWKQSVIS